MDAAGCAPLAGAKNVVIRVDGGCLYVYCDLRKDFGASSSGRTIIIASSSGNKPLGRSNAFLGLNLFIKDITKRDLSPKATTPLSMFTPLNGEIDSPCGWRIEADGYTLCIRLDLAHAKEKPATSGKSVLLASTGGNKPVASTGIMCGLNCYRSVNTAFDVTKLTAEGVVAAGETAKVGDRVELGGGFLMHYATSSRVELLYTGDADTLKTTKEPIAMPPCRIGETTLSLVLHAPKAKRAKTEAASSTSPSSSPPPSSQAEGGEDALAASAGTKLRNVHVTCDAAPEGNGVTLCVSFDPTQSFGRSASGKSIIVSSTSGFQAVESSAGPVCRVGFNAYQPAPPLSDAEVQTAVQAVLSRKSQDELPSLSFKVVLGEVLGVLGLTEQNGDLVKDRVKTAVKAFMSGELAP